MKKLLFIVMALIGVISAQAKDPMTLESGSLADLADSSKSVLFKVDYSNAVVHNDGNEYTLEGYLEHRGPDFVADWKKDETTVYAYLPARFNSKNKKGAKAFETDGAQQYDILATIHLSDIDFGNGAGTFMPFAGAKAGGCIISGKLVFTDAEGKELAQLPFTEVKGLGHVSETIRLGMSYFELMNKLGDVLKKENKKKK
ncbi:MAG: hypothetical protein K2G75_00705 [Muribaculaceae bacterium]|nr:hypothetical protein [Muribaculaceae bacterium]MDE5923816.1 hypothetical protein [Muribaculaceae bacterium]